MKNIVYILDKKNSFIKKEVCLKSLMPTYVRVRNHYCGICGSDYSAFIGRRNKYNISLGHEFVAEVVEVGTNVINFALGDIVISDFNYRCGECKYCKSKKSHLCDYNDIQHFSNRAFAQYSDIESSYLVKINNFKDNIIAATCVEPLSCVIHAVNSMPFHGNILVYGCGSIGTLIAFYLRTVNGIETVYVYDIIEEKAQRLSEHFSCNLYDNNIEYDCVFEATNEAKGLYDAILKCNKGGNVCSISHLYGVNTSTIYDLLLKNEINIKFPLRNGQKDNLQIAGEYIANYWEKAFNSVFDIIDLNQINEAFQNKKTNIFNKQIISLR